MIDELISYIEQGGTLNVSYSQFSNVQTNDQPFWTIKFNGVDIEAIGQGQERIYTEKYSIDFLLNSQQDCLNFYKLIDSKFSYLKLTLIQIGVTDPNLYDSSIYPTGLDIRYIDDNDNRFISSFNINIIYRKKVPIKP